MSIVIVKAVQTSMACPSQWDAWDSDGRYWYLRYRSGHGSARRIAEGPGWYEDDEYDGPQEVLAFDYGHPLDGDISLEDFARLAGLELSPSLASTGYGEHLALHLAAALEEAPGMTDEAWAAWQAEDGSA